MTGGGNVCGGCIKLEPEGKSSHRRRRCDRDGEKKGGLMWGLRHGVEGGGVIITDKARGLLRAIQREEREKRKAGQQNVEKKQSCCRSFREVQLFVNLPSTRRGVGMAK